MTRTEVLQRIIDRTRARTYLEIGVHAGVSFMPIRIRRKIAVDPWFAITRESRVKWLLLNPANMAARYHQVTSDGYFAGRLPGADLDVVFIDGLHTFEQSLKDVLNSLQGLSPKGAIVMHDCSPPHAAAAHPAPSYHAAAELKLSGWDDRWTGDVWKTICYLRSQRTDLRVFVLDCDLGVGVVTRGTPESALEMSEDQLLGLTYADLERDRVRLLNLKDEGYLGEFLETL